MSWLTSCELPGFNIVVEKEEAENKPATTQLVNNVPEADFKKKKKKIKKEEKSSVQVGVWSPAEFLPEESGWKIRKGRKGRTSVKSPIGMVFDSRKKALIYMKTNQYHLEHLPGILQGLKTDGSWCQDEMLPPDWLYREKKIGGCEFLDDNFLLLGNNTDARKNIETRFDQEILNNFDQFINKRLKYKRKSKSSSPPSNEHYPKPNIIQNNS